MQRLDVEELRPSMVVATTIKDKNGNMMLLRGTPLTDKQIEILKARGIKKISVEGSPVRRVGGPDEEMRKEIEMIFSTAGHHPVVLKIKETIGELLS